MERKQKKKTDSLRAKSRENPKYCQAGRVSANSGFHLIEVKAGTSIVKAANLKLVYYYLLGVVLLTMKIAVR